MKDYIGKCSNIQFAKHNKMTLINFVPCFPRCLNKINVSCLATQVNRNNNFSFVTREKYPYSWILFVGCRKSDCRRLDKRRWGIRCVCDVSRSLCIAKKFKYIYIPLLSCFVHVVCLCMRCDELGYICTLPTHISSEHTAFNVKTLLKPCWFRLRQQKYSLIEVEFTSGESVVRDLSRSERLCICTIDICHVWTEHKCQHSKLKWITDSHAEYSSSSQRGNAGEQKRNDITHRIMRCMRINMHGFTMISSEMDLKHSWYFSLGGFSFFVLSMA